MDLEQFANARPGIVPEPMGSKCDCLARPSTTLATRRACRNDCEYTPRPRQALPEVLDDALLERHRQRLREEFRPSTPTAEILTDEVARHAVALQRAEQIEAAVMRRGARAASLLLEHLPLDADQEQAMLAGAAAGDLLERITRYRRSHERGLHNSLAQLRVHQAATAPPTCRRPSPPSQQFQTEAECVAYLLDRLRRGHCACPRCGQSGGYWLARRQRRQCAHCKHQMGLRAGTVMARSPLPLKPWLAAIECLVADPATPIDVLSEVTGVRRRPTLRRMKDRILAAMHAENRRDLLAGLDENDVAEGITPAESGARCSQKTASRTGSHDEH
jgi:transposase-like protein